MLVNEGSVFRNGKSAMQNGVNPSNVSGNRYGLSHGRQEPGIEVLRGFGADPAIAHRSAERVAELITSFTDT